MIIEIKNSLLAVMVDTLGGELRSIKRDNLEYLWQGNPDYWHGQAPNLFPFIGRLYEGKYKLNKNTYPMPIHGFLKKNELEVLKKGEDYLSLALESNDTLKEIYPYDFKLILTYRLIENKLAIEAKVINNSNELMYFALGGHPGFNVPLNDNLSFDDYYLEFKDECHPKAVEFSKDSVLYTGVKNDFKLEGNRRISLHHNIFDNEAIILDFVSKEVMIKSDKDSRSVKVSYPDMRYIGFWHMPRLDCPYVCIEPWSSLPGRDKEILDIAKRDDFIKVNENEEYINSWSIEIN